MKNYQNFGGVTAVDRNALFEKFKGLRREFRSIWNVLVVLLAYVALHGCHPIRSECTRFV